MARAQINRCSPDLGRSSAGKARSISPRRVFRAVLRDVIETGTIPDYLLRLDEADLLWVTPQAAVTEAVAGFGAGLAPLSGLTIEAGRAGATSGGQREFAPVLARAACSVGVSAVFIETHEDPDNAPCDGPNMIPIDQMASLVATLRAFDDLFKALD